MTCIYDERGDLVKILCSGCGKVIGEEVVVKKGDREAWAFQRSPDYVEAKVLLDNNPPHYHVTNGCKTCLRADTSADILTEWVQGDIREQTLGKINKIKAVKVVQLGIGIT